MKKTWATWQDPIPLSPRCNLLIFITSKSNKSFCRLCMKYDGIKTINFQCLFEWDYFVVKFICWGNMSYQGRKEQVSSLPHGGSRSRFIALNNSSRASFQSALWWSDTALARVCTVYTMVSNVRSKSCLLRWPLCWERREVRRLTSGRLFGRMSSQITSSLLTLLREASSTFGISIRLFSPSTCRPVSRIWNASCCEWTRRCAECENCFFRG